EHAHSVGDLGARLGSHHRCGALWAALDMKTIENDARLPAWLNGVLNRWPACIHRDAVATIFTIAWDEHGIDRPENVSLYYNGFLFVRLCWPFGIWLHLKPMRNLRFQCGGGWAL